jgi:hypothetical protein
MKCKLNCGGYCRRQDGTCSARHSKRGFCWKKWLAASKRSATPLRSSPKSTVKQRRRLYSKQPSSTSVSLPLELPDAKLRDSALIDHCLSPEAPSTTNVSFFQFRCSLEPKIPGNLACLSRAIAKYFPNAVKEMGEASALAVYGRISAILQKLPNDKTFEPNIAYVAALFQIAWELAGDGDFAAPKFEGASQTEITIAVCVLLNHIGK